MQTTQARGAGRRDPPHRPIALQGMAAQGGARTPSRARLPDIRSPSFDPGSSNDSALRGRCTRGSAFVIRPVTRELPIADPGTFLRANGRPTCIVSGLFGSPLPYDVS